MFVDFKRQVLSLSGIFLVVIFVIFSQLNRILPKSTNVLCSDCNVIVVAYDALQATHVSHIGYHRKTTPMMDSIASQGVAFSNAVTVAPWTIPSYMSIFTGLYPSQHKLVNKWVDYSETQKVPANLSSISPKIQTLAEILKLNGYVTAGFTGNSGVSGSFGYNKGFDIYKDQRQFGSIGGYADEALNWLEANKENKFFLFIQGYDAHGQFHTPENYVGKFNDPGYDGRYKGTWQEQALLRDELLYEKKNINLRPEDIQFWRNWYDSKISDGDAKFAEFWEQFSKIPTKNKTIIIMLSDHGTEFYEHKRFDHGFSLYDELVRVPLVFKVPGVQGGRVIDQQVRTIDISPTLIELLGIDPGKQYSSQLEGKSLVNVINGGNIEGRDAFLETDFLRFTYKRGIRTADGWKYIRTMESGEEELYNIKLDPSESLNLVNDDKAKTEELRFKVMSHIKDIGGNVDGPWTLGCFPVYAEQCKQ